VTEVPSRYPNKPPTVKPNVVLDYTKHIGGVDFIDHFITLYQFMRRTKKWYRRTFFCLLEVSIVNSYLLYVLMHEQNSKKQDKILWNP
jgi:hypothetical protein